MNILINLLITFTLVFCINCITFGQEIHETFRPNIFKYSANEIPVTIGLSGGLGPSLELIGAGAHLNLDVFHFYLGYRIVTSPVDLLPQKDTKDEQAYYFGYRYRKNKYEISVGSGFGKTRFYKCTGGDSDGCANYELGTYKTTPLIVEYSYFPVSFIGGTSTLNISFRENRFMLVLLCGIKVGISRKPKA